MLWGGQDILTFGMRALVLSGQDPLVTTWLHEGETVPFNKGNYVVQHLVSPQERNAELH